MAARVSNGSRKMWLMMLAVCFIGATARPSHKQPPAPTSTAKPSLPPLPKLVIPVIKTAEINTQSAANAGARDTSCGPVLAVGTGVGIKIKQDGTEQKADAKTGAQGGCGSLFAQVQGGTKTKVAGKDPLSADSTTTLIGVKGITVGISQSHTGGLVPSGKLSVPAKAIGVVAQSSGLASDAQKTTHAGSGTITSDGTTVTNTAGDIIKAQVHNIIRKTKCLKGGKGCPPRPSLPKVKPTLPTLPTPTLRPKKYKH